MELELRGNNLYRNGEIIVFDNTDEKLLHRELLSIKGTVKDTYYTVKMNDRIDLIAFNHYKNQVEDASKYWWVIADANNITNPLDLSEYIGKEILIPNILNTLMILQQ